MTTRPARVALLCAMALAVALALYACATSAPDIDRTASAPALVGFGQTTMSITTSSSSARRWFEQGMQQAYAFNEVEAVRSFKAALAQDESCAMCAWGVAYQLGPNLGGAGRGGMQEALRYVDHALRHSQKASDLERSLIESLAIRYGHGSQARAVAVLALPLCGPGDTSGEADPLDVAYARQMRLLADEYPNDPDVQSLYAEAELLATHDTWWDPQTGQPAGRVGQVAQRLEQALKDNPEHVGLNHYLIHAVDAQPVAKRAEGAADRLGQLAPNAPHLLHMPSHIYVRLGRYGDAVRVNQQSVAADEALAADLSRQGFSNSKDWRGHDGHFLWYAALMHGQGDLALEAARQSAALEVKMDGPLGEFVRIRPLLTLVRLERWESVLAEPANRRDKGLGRVLSHYARGVAQARLGRPQQAADELAQLGPVATSLVTAHVSDSYIDRTVRGLVAVARQTLRAEVALGEGRQADALSFQAAALSEAEGIEQNEPPMLAASTRLALGDMQLRTGHGAEAEQTFRTELTEHPQSGWAWRGLARALKAQGQAAASAEVRVLLNNEWRSADRHLLAVD